MNIFSKGIRFLKRKVAQIIYFFIRESFDEFAGNSATLQNIQNLQRIISEEINSDRFRAREQGEAIGKVKERAREQGEETDRVKEQVREQGEETDRVKEQVREQGSGIENLDGRIAEGQKFSITISNRCDEFSDFVGFSANKLKLKKRFGEIPKIDYVAFENKYRGDESLIKKRQSVFLEYFGKCKNVLDIGCGRGEFLELLKENGIYATGIDIEEGMVNRCKEKGLNAIRVDVFEFLEDLANEEIDGVFCSQVIEHFSFKEIQLLMYMLGIKLRKDGIALFETINTRCVEAMGMFYLDITHIQPVDVESLLFIAKSYGFRHNDTILSSSVVESMPFISKDLLEISQYRDYALVVNKV